VELKATLFQFTDDGVVVYEAKSIENLLVMISEDLKALVEFFSTIKLPMNLNKTKYMIFKIPRTLFVFLTQPVFLCVKN
jgi:hypothetical protein